MKKPIGYQFEDADKADAEAWFLVEANLKAAHASINKTILKQEQLKRTSPRGKENAYEVSGDFSHIDALFVYAVTMYLRCFATGRRQRLLIDDVSGISKVDLITHQNIRLLRNRHFAHRVSDEHEGAEILLIVSTDKMSKLGFACWTVQYFCEAVPELRRFARLIAKVLKHVQKSGQVSADKLSKRFFGASAKWKSCQYRLPDSQLADNGAVT